MTDKTELKRLATPIGWFTDDHLTDKSATTYDKAVANRWCEKGWPVQALYDGAVARDLVAENEELAARVSEMHEDRIEAVAEIVVQGMEIDQFKAENEALRKALGDLLDLYDTDEGCRSLPQYIAGRAAMGKGEQS